MCINNVEWDFKGIEVSKAIASLLLSSFYMTGYNKCLTCTITFNPHSSPVRTWYYYTYLIEQEMGVTQLGHLGFKPWSCGSRAQAISPVLPLIGRYLSAHIEYSGQD